MHAMLYQTRSVGPTCTWVSCGLPGHEDKMGFPSGTDVGFQWVTDGLFYYRALIGFPEMGPCGLYEGYPLGMPMWNPHSLGETLTMVAWLSMVNHG